MTTREGRPEPFAWIDTTGAPVERKEVGDLPGSKFSPRQTLEAADAVKVLAHDGIIRCHTTFRHPFNFSWSGKTCDIRRSSKTTS